jgi:type VI secretion system lysozyme-like protein
MLPDYTFNHQNTPFLDRFSNSNHPNATIGLRTGGTGNSPFLQSIISNMMWVLNSRQCPVVFQPEPNDDDDVEPFVDPEWEPTPPLGASLLDYGIPDFTGKNPLNPFVRSWMCQQIAEAISRFEPRLTSVRVMDYPPAPNSQKLLFRITALVKTGRDPHRISFETVFNTGQGTYNFEEI